MLTAVKKGKKVNEEEMPPPVASGKSSVTTPQAMPLNDLPKNSGSQDEITVPEGEENEGSTTDHELQNPSNPELSVSTPDLQSQDADSGVLGTSSTSENSK